MLSLFSKSKIPVERQLDELGAIGLRLTEGVGVDDLFLYDSRGNMEKKPYSALITALGYCTEDGEDTPFCRSLWMCDYEGIEGYGDYVVLIRHLQVLSEERPALSNIQDYVEIGDNKAWIEFDLNGGRIHWDLEVDNDWLDPFLFVKYDQLLAEHTDLRIYSNHTDFGQSALLGCFTSNQFDKLNRLSKVKFMQIADQV